MPFAISTSRLILREWRDADIAPFAAMNSDPEVMRYFERTRTASESASLVARLRALFAADGFCFWALELPGEADFIGFTGLMRVPFAAAFTPSVEIGWRLARPFWGRGLAREAARAALADGFGRCRLREIVAYTVPDNQRSRRVMEAIGMRYDPGGDFDHPHVAEGSPMRRHVLYRIADIP